MNELTGALQAVFWLLDGLGPITAWRAAGDALQGNVERPKGNRKKGTPNPSPGRSYLGRPPAKSLTNGNDTRKVSL